MILQKNSPPPAVPKKKRRIWPYVAVVFLFFAAAAAGALFASTSLLDKEKPKAEEAHLCACCAARTPGVGKLVVAVLNKPGGASCAVFPL